MANQARGTRRIPAPQQRVDIIEKAFCCDTCGREVAAPAPAQVRGGNRCCLRCLGWDDLVVLEAGNISLTKQAVKFAPVAVAVYRRPVVGPSRKPVRIGILVPRSAVVRAFVRARANAEFRAESRDVPALALDYFEPNLD